MALPCAGCERRRAFLVGIAVAVSIPIAKAVARLAPGRSPGPLAAWFQGAHMPNGGGSCCGVADGHLCRAKFDGAHWWALIDGVWIKVPQRAILWNYPPYPDGSAVVWTTAGDAPFIFCFRPPASGA